jgi:hypothetical protein
MERKPDIELRYCKRFVSRHDVLVEGASGRTYWFKWMDERVFHDTDSRATTSDKSECVSNE